MIFPQVASSTILPKKKDFYFGNYFRDNLFLSMAKVNMELDEMLCVDKHELQTMLHSFV